jgi:hypothetical protein
MQWCLSEVVVAYHRRGRKNVTFEGVEMFRNKIAQFWLAISVFACAAILSTPSYALPSFARQTNKACSACHFENFPMLTDYGRAFKASGFTEVYAPEYVRRNTDAAEMSLPLVLNASFFGTMRYDRYSGNTVNAAGQQTNADFSEWTVPEEASLFISGRVAEYVGFHSEIGLRPSTALAALKLPFSFPINDSMRVLVVPFAADGHGPSYGFEVLNTGASDIHLTFEHEAQASTYSYFRIEETGATGAAAVLWDPRFFVSFTKWAPTYGGPAGIGSNYSPGSAIQTGKGPNANYFRGVYFVPIRGWDTAVGIQVFTGSAAVSYDSTSGCCFNGAYQETKAWIIDAQIQGSIFNHQLGVYFTHGLAPASPSNADPVSGNAENLFNFTDRAAGMGVNTKSATTLTASYSLIPYKLNLTAAVLVANNGSDRAITGVSASDNAYTLGLVYMFAQNVKMFFEGTKLQNPGWFDGITTTNGQIATGIKQQLTFKLMYDL